MENQTYKTAAATVAEELDVQVNALLKEGYQLYGHPCMNEKYIVQAMVRTGVPETTKFRPSIIA